MPSDELDQRQLVAYIVTFRDSCFDSLLPSAEALKRSLYAELAPLSRGVVVLSTCNRFEVYLDSPAPVRVEELLRARLVAPRRLEGWGAVEHLMRVASGLESAILGEDEILGQVREAWIEARREGYSSELLDAVFHAAITAGSRARSETGISRGVLGYPQAAVELAARLFGSLDGARVLVVGAGMAARAMVQHLCSKWSPAELVIADRRPERASELARACSGTRAIALAEAPSAGAFDVAFVAIKGGLRPELEPLRGSTKIIIDISTPPAVEGSDATIHDVEKIVEDNIRLRTSQVPAVESVIREEMERLSEFLRRKAIDHVISSIMRSVNSIIEEEAKVTAKNIAAGVDPYQAVQVALNSTVKKVLWPLFSYLREDPEARLDIAKEIAKRYEDLASRG